jgi:hypothetical protein
MAWVFRQILPQIGINSLLVATDFADFTDRVGLSGDNFQFFHTHRIL